MAFYTLLNLNVSGMARPQNENGDGLQIWKWLLNLHHEIRTVSVSVKSCSCANSTFRAQSSLVELNILCDFPFQVAVTFQFFYTISILTTAIFEIVNIMLVFYYFKKL
jgi:hypothetical protein